MAGLRARGPDGVEDDGDEVGSFPRAGVRAWATRYVRPSGWSAFKRLGMRRGDGWQRRLRCHDQHG